MAELRFDGGREYVWKDGKCGRMRLRFRRNGGKVEPRIDGPISLFGMGRSGFLRRSMFQVRRVLGGGREGGSHCGYEWTRQTGIPCERWKMCSKALRITLRWKKSTHSFQSDSDCLFKLTDGEEGKVDSCGAEGSWEDYAGCFVDDWNGDLMVLERQSPRS